MRRAGYLLLAFAFAFAFALALGFAALAARADTTPLKRLTLRSDLSGWEAVGRLDLGDRGFCTGVLVAPTLVLTAGHCLADAAREQRVDHLTFRAGLTDGHGSDGNTCWHLHSRE